MLSLELIDHLWLSVVLVERDFLSVDGKISIDQLLKFAVFYFRGKWFFMISVRRWEGSEDPPTRRRRFYGSDSPPVLLLNVFLTVTTSTKIPP